VLLLSCQTIIGICPGHNPTAQDNNVYIELIFLRPVPLGQQNQLYSLLFSFFDPSTSRVHIMDINRFNFWHTIPVVLEAISLSDYVAFDLEMTGVTGHSSSKTPAYTQATAYRLAVEAATTF
jgi:hypothetical protein